MKNRNNVSLRHPKEHFQEIIAETASMMGSFAAVIVQISHPRVAKAVTTHSDVRENAVKRGRRSLIYIYCMALGTQEEREFILSETREAHSEVGSPDVDDPELQLFVALVIYKFMVTSYENVYGRLKKNEAEDIYQEFSILATELAMMNHEDMGWPKDLTAFEEYWEEMIKFILETDTSKETKELVKFILTPRGLFPEALPAWIFMCIFGWIVKIITIEMLPEPVRKNFRLSSTAYTRAMYQAIMWLIRRFYPSLPRFVRHGVKNFYMSNMRKRSKRGMPW
ncbi:hypothetical protein F5884DRAFT_687636 [Xylogone sp. PMI_703]|nr:hypothetical protein F5884DRAFT_687636 [Xylogone sp. PMI_703]